GRVVLDVLVEPALVPEDVVADAAEEGDIGARADTDPVGAHRARAREARVDVEDPRTSLPCLHHPLEPDRMVLGHVRAHDRDHVRVPAVLPEGGGASSPERAPQTRDRGAASYARLVLHLDPPEGEAPPLDQAVLLVAEGRVAEVP